MVWVLDPERRTAEVYRADVPPQFLDHDGEIDGAEVLPGFVVRLGGVRVD